MMDNVLTYWIGGVPDTIRQKAIDNLQQKDSRSPILGLIALELRNEAIQSGLMENDTTFIGMDIVESAVISGRCPEDRLSTLRNTVYSGLRTGKHIFWDEIYNDKPKSIGRPSRQYQPFSTLEINKRLALINYESIERELYSTELLPGLVVNLRDYRTLLIKSIVANRDIQMSREEWGLLLGSSGKTARKMIKRSGVEDIPQYHEQFFDNYPSERLIRHYAHIFGGRTINIRRENGGYIVRYRVANRQRISSIKDYDVQAPKE